MANQNEDLCKEFQKTVSLYLVRHRSILDVMTKYQESCGRVNRAIAKAVTTCGCLKIEAEKQSLPADATLLEMSQYVNSHLEGRICSNCSEVLEEEMGKALFFLTAMCVLTGMDLGEIIRKENDRIATLGVYSLT